MILRKKKTLELLEILWEDITDMGGWINCKDLPEEEMSPLLITHVGFKVQETKGHLYLSPMHAGSMDSDKWGGVCIIPKPNIRKRKVIGKIQVESFDQ